MVVNPDRDSSRICSCIHGCFPTVLVYYDTWPQTAPRPRHSWRYRYVRKKYNLIGILRPLMHCAHGSRLHVLYLLEGSKPPQGLKLVHALPRFLVCFRHVWMSRCFETLVPFFFFFAPASTQQRRIPNRDLSHQWTPSDQYGLTGGGK